MKELRKSFCKLSLKAKLLLVVIITIWLLITVALIHEIDSVSKISKYLSSLMSIELVAYSGLIYVGRGFFIRFGKIMHTIELYQRDTRRAFRLVDRNTDKHQDEIKRLHKEIAELKTEINHIKELINGKS